MKVMIIEDDQVIRELLGESLKKWNYDVVMLNSFENVLEDFLSEQPTILLLDINLPLFDGFYWCNKIRGVSKVPIIFISSRDSPMDMIMAMNMGGDDFIQKPFDMEVLMAKINALLRRSYSYSETQSNVLEHNEVKLNLNDWDIYCGDEKAELTKTEFVILHLLMKNAGSIVSRNKIMRTLWKNEHFIDDNTLSVNITRLRKKLSQLGKENFITTKKGEGYLIK
ncbi:MULTISPECIES: response regulator transcription factor [Bacillales]|uniref:response regulator transcription factor n=1 Tax=Bacillales TaxID=1385 RepID=UPI00047D7BFF|nr:MULTISPECIES: response regulator transcription factor [Bacillaceae]MCP1146105.1 response regulator transcription factor [Lysinibacillus endophyticus]HWK23813.1 response regulator transcription factor [Ureibacillus sp.]